MQNFTHFPDDEGKMKDDCRKDTKAKELLVGLLCGSYLYPFYMSRPAL